MGTWGAGNFENDGALDYYGDFIDGLAETVEKMFSSEGGVDLDEAGESELMPTVAIITALCEHCHSSPPQPSTVKSWCQRYLAIYDQQIDGLDPQGDFKTERREVIQNTFLKLEQLATDFWQES